MNIIKINNLEKNKLYFKVSFKIKKNIKLYLITEGCYNNKYIFYYTKLIKKNNLIIKYKSKYLILNNLNVIKLKNILIKFKKILKIKNKMINKKCNCNFSFII
ncbi:hypothetical protein NDNC_0110 [Candidatus Nasuia deltocephalinicola]|nr:hypothetical protein QUR95_00730 [Candidatus Nasuia deltocephalinicola]BEH03845.1 hypothetical protein NDNC_0110 [Candidatus Nasuia deltocephalinicola]